MLEICTSRGFKISTLRTKYLRCSFRGGEKDSREVTIDGVALPKVKKFRNLGSTMEKKGDFDKDMNHHIKVGWKKERMLQECYVTKIYQ